MDESRIQQDHIPSLIHDGSAAVSARDLAGKLVLCGLFSGLVPAEVVVAVSEVDVVFVEDGGPLERGGCMKEITLAIISVSDLLLFFTLYFPLPPQ